MMSEWWSSNMPVNDLHQRSRWLPMSGVTAPCLLSTRLAAAEPDVAPTHDGMP
jgi:hypothetical protein